MNFVLAVKDDCHSEKLKLQKMVMRYFLVNVMAFELDFFFILPEVELVSTVFALNGLIL